MSIWDEKPKSFSVHPMTRHQNYDAREIDPWLEKLKIEYDDMRQTLLSIDLVKASNTPLVEAHRDRLWIAMGEIEDRVTAHTKQLTGLYTQKLWVPVAERKKDDERAQPDFFDGLADYTEFLRPIILGAK